jgi:anti-sigma factor RsiW
MTDRWLDRLSEYLDGELSDTERREMEQHLFACAECAAALEDLRNVVARASALEPLPPERDLWPDIAQRIGAVSPGRGSDVADRRGVVDLEARRAARRRRLSFSLPQLAAASLVLMLVSGSAVWLLNRFGHETVPAPIAQAGGRTPAAGGEAISPAGGAPSGALPASFTESQYDAAVGDLERALQQGRSRLDPETVRIIERNLQTIDRAISEARQALAADPASAYLNDYLARTMRKKLDLLRQANAIATTRT